MSFSTGSSSSQSSDINVTPLIDVLLVLLIIFMAMVPTQHRGLDSSLPQGKAREASLPPVTVQVVHGSGAMPAQYLVNSHVVPSGELETALKALFAVQDDRTLFIQADSDLSYQQVVSVVGVGRAAGAGQVSLSRLATS